MSTTKNCLTCKWRPEWEYRKFDLGPGDIGVGDCRAPVPAWLNGYVVACGDENMVIEVDMLGKGIKYLTCNGSCIAENSRQEIISCPTWAPNLELE